jgi:hypothetical protein
MVMMMPVREFLTELTPTLIMSMNPMPMLPMPGDPDPLVTFIPIARTIGVIRLIADVDREIDRHRARTQEHAERQDRHGKNCKFSFHHYQFFVRARLRGRILHPMKMFYSLSALFGALLLCLPIFAADEEAEDSSVGLPAAYAKDYLIAASTLSPDKKFAVIYPTSDDEEPSTVKNHVVSLRPFAIIGTLDTKDPYFKNRSHGGLSAKWSRDSSVALITLASKWGPGDIFLLELRDGKLARATNLLDKVHDLLVPDYRKAKAVPYNDNYDFVFEAEDESPCKLEGTKSVRINALAATDPKGAEPGRVWKGRIVATWDIGQAKFTSQKATRVFAGIRKSED